MQTSPRQAVAVPLNGRRSEMCDLARLAGLIQESIAALALVPVWVATRPWISEWVAPASGWVSPTAPASGSTATAARVPTLNASRAPIPARFTLVAPVLTRLPMLALLAVWAALLAPASAWAADTCGCGSRRAERPGGSSTVLSPVPGLPWGLPFLGLLLSIAVLPALAPRFWTRRMGLVSLAWTLVLLLPRAAEAGLGTAASEAWHALLIEYLPFATLLLALYTAGGGVHLQGGPAGTPAGNTIMLALGVVLGLLVGTTAAAIVVIQPLLHANAHRRRRMHLVLFLVVLVANAAGALTPLGNPPLYVGLLRGVPFFWPATHLLPHFLLLTAILLAAFWVLDNRLAATEPTAPRPSQAAAARLEQCRADPGGRGRGPRAGVRPSRNGELARAANRHRTPGRDRRVHRGHRGVAVLHATCDPPGERFRLAPDGGGGDTVRRDLHHHRPGGGNAARRAGRAAGAAAATHAGWSRPADPVAVFLAEWAAVGVSR